MEDCYYCSKETQNENPYCIRCQIVICAACIERLEEEHCHLCNRHMCDNEAVFACRECKRDVCKECIAGSCTFGDHRFCNECAPKVRYVGLYPLGDNFCTECTYAQYAKMDIKEFIKIEANDREYLSNKKA